MRHLIELQSYESSASPSPAPPNGDACTPRTDSNNGASPSHKTASRPRQRDALIGLRTSMRRRCERMSCFYFSLFLSLSSSPFSSPPHPSFTELYIDLNELYHRGLVRVLSAAMVGPKLRKHVFPPDYVSGAARRRSP